MPIPSTAHPTYNDVVLTAVVGPMHRSDGHVKNSILVHPPTLSYFKTYTLVDLMGLFCRSDGHFS